MMFKRLLAYFTRNIWRKYKTIVLVCIGIITIGVYTSQDYGNVIERPIVYKNVLTSPLQDNLTPTANIASVQDGYQNAKATQEACANHSSSIRRSEDITLRYSKQNDLMFCPLYKVGSTFWRRVFMVQREAKYAKLPHPYAISFDKEYEASRYSITSLQNQTSFKVLFTRDPYMRLLSTYVDKLVAPNPYFWKLLGTQIIKLTRPKASSFSIRCGHDVTFREFIKYVVHSLKTNKDVDPHFVQMDSNCRLCRIAYDFIGKMEHFAEDSEVILDKLNLKHMSSVLKEDGIKLAAEDAIKDTLTQPFSFKKHYLKCISFSDALQRAWKKLQIRGLIGNDSLPDKIDERTFDSMLQHAKKSRDVSTKQIRSIMKAATIREYWGSVEFKDKNELRNLYSNDFKLFNYDDTPAYVFQSHD